MGRRLACAWVWLTVTVAASQPPHERMRETRSAPERRLEGLSLGYNLDYPEAFERFSAAIEADPDDAAAHRLIAATAWISILFESGAVTVDDYLGQATDKKTRQPPDPTVATRFAAHLRRAIALNEARAKRQPNDPAALYQLGATYGIQASYTATIEGSLVDSFGPARRAYKAHEKVLALDPTRKDAGLIVGLYRYSLASLSAPMRLVARMAGFEIDRESGLRLVEEAAQYSSDAQPNAKFSLVLLYNREKRYDDALRVIADLQRSFPRNRLLWLEAASAQLRAGRFAEARRASERGLEVFAADHRPRARGEESRWRLVYGSALVPLGAQDAAARELTLAAERATRDWVRGRIEKELGKLADLAGDRDAALAYYRTAAELCGRDNDGECRDDARALGRRPYRVPPTVSVKEAR